MPIFQQVIVKSWWVILFMLLCYMFYEQGMRKRDFDYTRLYSQLEELKEQKKRALAVQDDLLLQINSQSDPDWVELTLMKGLGLVPEGYIKAYFK